MTGNTGNTGNTGRAGNGGGGGGIVADGWVYADRIDYPFVLEAGGDAALRLPTPPDPIASLPAFPDQRWGANWRAWLVLTEFIAAVEQKPGKWQDYHIDRPRPTGAQTFEPGSIPQTPNELEQELSILLGYAQDNRADALDEIVSQHEEFLSYFAGLLQIAPGSRPATRTLLHIAELAATAAVMHFKSDKMRARPSTLCPALFPPLSVPSHPAWPSGHATQARLAYNLLTLALTGTVTVGGVAQGPIPGDHRPIVQTLEILANRIAKNREIAGFHFPSDTVAGKNLGDDIVVDLVKCPTFVKVVAAAKAEAW